MNAVPSSALDLLHVAADALRQDLLPHLNAEQKHAALMVSHALGIVGRELSAAAHLLEVERDVLAKFVGPPGDGGMALDGMVLGMRRRIAAGLRAGQFDADELAMQQALHALVRLRCSVDAPRALI